MKDNKLLIIYLVIISMFLLSMMTLIAYSQSSVDTNNTNTAKSYILYNPNTESVIECKNQDLRLPMASTTKIITALLAIERLDPNKKIKICKESVGIEGSSVYLEEGDTVYVKDLIYSIMLQSANDAATAIAIEIGGSIEAFAEIMNERAEKIGAHNTSFKNPHGLDDPEHYTTAYDLAIITAEALKNPVFKNIAGTYKYTFTIGDKVRTVVNHNKLLKQYDGCIGVKTGYTKKSGRCLVSAAERDGLQLIAVTLSATDDWNMHKAMLNHGFDILEIVNITEKINIPHEISVIGSNKQTLQIGISRKDESLVHIKGSKLSVCDIDIPLYIAEPHKKDDKIGTVVISNNGQKINIDIIALEDVTIDKNNSIFGRK